MDRRCKSNRNMKMRRLGRCVCAVCLAFVIADGSRADEPEVEVRRSVVYANVEDEELTADVYLPAGEGPYPGVLMVHGGAWLGGTRREKEELYRQASPMAFVTAAAPPMFLYHGEKDLLVLPHGPKALKEALDDVGVATQLVMVPDDGHIGAFMHADALAAAYAFLDSYMQPKTAAATGRPTCETVAGTR